MNALIVFFYWEGLVGDYRVWQNDWQTKGMAVREEGLWVLHDLCVPQNISLELARFKDKCVSKHLLCCMHVLSLVRAMAYAAGALCRPFFSQTTQTPTRKQL